MLVYAEEEDVITWTGDSNTPDNVDQLIRAASVLVRRATRFAAYDTTPAGAPADDDIADGFRDAVCAQVEWWTLNAIDPAVDSAAVGSRVKTASLGSASITYEDTTAAKVAAVTTLCPDAVDIITTLGVNTQPVAL